MPVTIHAVPSTDHAFARVVAEAARSADTPAELLAMLRSLYPSVVVSERQLSDEPRVYYVYRDGRLLSDDKRPWWTDAGVAWADVDVESGRLRGANEELLSMLGVPASVLVGRHFTELVMPEARSTAQTLFDSLVNLDEVRSGVHVRRADGSGLDLEFRAARDGDVIRVHCRPRGSLPSRA